MKKIYTLVILIGVAFQSWGQSSSPAQTLRLATSTYEQGRLHELEGILTNLSEFTVEQKVAAYKLLTQAYIYLEEPKKADETMLKLLETDHYFEVNKEIDPAEFVALYKTFRTDPIYSVGIKLGLAGVAPLLITDYYTTSGSAGTGKFNPGIGFLGGLFFEKKIYKNFIASPEILFASRVFNSESKLFVDDLSGINDGSIISTYKQNWIDLNAIVQYQLNKGAFKTYLAAGPGISYNIKSSKQTVTTGLSKSSVSGPDIDIKDSTAPLLFTINIGGGFKYRIGSIIVHGEVRYMQGLNNVVNENLRTNYENVLDYGDQLNDLSVSSFLGTVGFSLPIFKPAKIKTQ
jgi:hypothetical protein